MKPRAKTRLEAASREELEGAERRERVKVVRRDIMLVFLGNYKRRLIDGWRCLYIEEGLKDLIKK